MQEILSDKNKYRKLFYLTSPDLFAILVLLISGIVYVYGIGSFLDIFGNDESMYLYSGISFPLNFPNSEWSPLYALWYYFLHLIQPDSTILYYLNYILMTILPPVFIYIFLRVNKVQIIISFTLSLILLLSFSNFPTWPKVSHFALLFLLLGMIASTLLTDKKHKVMAFTISLLLVSFIRPEFFISFLLIGLILTVMYVLELFYEHTFKSVLPYISVFIFCLILLFIFGLPAGSGGRGFIAFGQHYARNWVKWNNDPRDPYYNYSIILKEDFGNAATVTDAVIKNPSAILKHMSENIRNIPDELIYMFLFFYPVGYPGITVLLTALLALIVSLILYSGKKNITNPIFFLKSVTENIKYFRFLFLIFLTALSPLIISSVFIYPRRHYLLFPGIIFILLLTIILFRNTNTPDKRQIYISFAYICLLPVILVRPMISLLNEPVPENKLAIKYLRTLDITKPVNILETWGIYSIYESKNYNRIPEYDKDVLFNEYLNKYSINMIVLTDRLSNDTRFSYDPEWIYFIKNSEEFGFTTVLIPDTKEIKLLIRKDILK